MHRLVVATLVLASAATGCSSGGGGGSIPSSSPAVNATSAPLLPTNVYALPDVTPSGFTRLLAELHGTPVVVNVWGSWCGPCRQEGPRLAAAARRYGRRVQFLGLDVKDFDKGPARAFIGQMGWTYPSLFDPTPTGDVEIQGIGKYAQPVTVFYSRAGKIVYQVSRPIPDAELATGIRRILA